MNIQFSVIIPTYNRPHELDRCLKSFTKLDYPAWELIVVNDGGGQSFATLDDRLLAKLPIKLIEQSNRGPAAARNAGAVIAQGQYLAFTDDDCEVTSTWLTDFANHLNETKLSAIGGQVQNPYPNNIAAETWQQYMMFLCNYFKDANGNHLLLPSNNIIYSKKVFDAIGGFDTSFPIAAAEDLDLGFRLVAAGHQQQLVSGAMILHHHQNTRVGYLKQQFRYGRGGYHFQKKRYDVSVLRYYRGQFYIKLVKRLWHIHASWQMWILILLTFIFHAMGKYYEKWRCADSVLGLKKRG